MFKAAHILKYVFAAISACSLVALISLEPWDWSQWQLIGLVYAAVGGAGAISFAAYNYIEKQEQAEKDYQHYVNARQVVRKFNK